jgi:hypothetical protein
MSKEAKPKRDKAEANQEKLTKDLVDNLCSTIKGRQVIWGAKQTGLVDSGLEDSHFISGDVPTAWTHITVIGCIGEMELGDARRTIAYAIFRFPVAPWACRHLASSPAFR